MARSAYKAIRKFMNKIPLILDLHENFPYTITTYNWTKGFIRNLISRPEEWKNKEKEYLGYADGIIVLSGDFRNLLINRYPDLSKQNFAVLPNVPDLTKMEQRSRGAIRSPFKHNFPILFYYGIIAERRGVFDALNIFINLVKEKYKVNFLLIGPVDKKDKTVFLNMINIELLSDRIHYIPWIDSTELSAYLEFVDICIAPFHKNPQHESGVANKIYEYMLGKNPIIASDCKPQQDLIEKHNCGLIFKDMSEFQTAIIKLLEDPDLRLKMGERGYEAIIKEYNTGITKTTLTDMYKTLTN
jgi:glycosyltransferase involved in cell wall biosynthesis